MNRKISLVLSLFLLISILISSGCLSEQTIQDTKPAPTIMKPVPEDTTKTLNLEDEKFIYSPEGENPFEPVITTVIKINIDKIKLVGIIWEEGNPTALVEDENKVGYMLREGDFVDPDNNIKVVSIDKKCIVFDIRKDLFHVTKKYCLK